MSATTLRQVPITCNGHTRPGLLEHSNVVFFIRSRLVVDLRFSDVTKYSYFLISACKGKSSFD